MSANAATLGAIKEVLRECLQLDPQAPIDDDMPLIGGDHDLDSLDMLLVVTSLEKEFDIKIPNEQLGPEIFSSVRAISDFIAQQRAGA